MDIPVYLPTEGHLGCVRVWNKAAISIFVYSFIWTFVFKYPECIPRSGIPGSCSNSMCKLLRNCKTVLQSGHTIFHFCQQCMRIPISLHSYSCYYSFLKIYSHPSIWEVIAPHWDFKCICGTITNCGQYTDCRTNIDYFNQWKSFSKPNIVISEVIRENVINE